MNPTIDTYFDSITTASVGYFSPGSNFLCGDQSSILSHDVSISRSFPVSIYTLLFFVYSTRAGVVTNLIHRQRMASFPTIYLHVGVICKFFLPFVMRHLGLFLISRCTFITIVVAWIPSWGRFIGLIICRIMAGGCPSEIWCLHTFQVVQGSISHVLRISYYIVPLSCLLIIVQIPLVIIHPCLWCFIWSQFLVSVPMCVVPYCILTFPV